MIVNPRFSIFVTKRQHISQVIGFMLITVRWDRISGKVRNCRCLLDTILSLCPMFYIQLPGVGLFLAAINFARVTARTQTSSPTRPQPLTPALRSDTALTRTIFTFVLCKPPLQHSSQHVSLTPVAATLSPEFSPSLR
jgi:hypothetical protein